MAKIIKTHLGDDPVNAGEKRLLDYLYVKLPDNYLVIPNGEYSSKTPQGAVKYWEYDAIVIAPHGIYHIENKDWNGSLFGDDFTWVVNGVERKNPHKTATLKTKILAGKLQNYNPSWRFGLIQTVVTLSYPGQSKFGLDPHSDCYEQTFLLNNELIDYLTDHAEGSFEELTKLLGVKPSNMKKLIDDLIADGIVIENSKDVFRLKA